MFQSVIEVIETNHSFVLSGHVAPDGDCLGAQVALFHLLRDQGKEVCIINADAPEPKFDFLQEHTSFHVLEPGRALPEHDVHCLLDCSTLDRLGRVGHAARKLHGVTRLVIDHHVGSDHGDGDVLLWDVDACSTGCLVYDLIRKMGAPMSMAAAEGVFLSIVSDTGWFRFSNTTDEALAIAADLVATGVKPQRIHQKLFERNAPETLGIMAEGLSLIEFEASGRLALCCMNKDFMERAVGVSFQTDEILNAMRAIDKVLLTLLLKERRDGRVKFSLRGSDTVDVDGLARKFGGGGHRKAAGAEIKGPLAQAKELVLAACLEELSGEA